MLLLSVTGPLAGKYLTHEVLKAGTGAAHAAKIYGVLVEYDSVDTLQAVLCDNTSVNTGHKTGAVTVLEKMLDRKVHKIGCLLHWNELPLREIIKRLDGKTLSGTAWSGPVGKRLSEEDIHLQPAVPFEPVATSLVRPADDVTKDLSGDQRLLLEYVLAVASGVIPESIVHRKPGPACMARWLTAATRILIIYTRTVAPSSNLQRIVAFIQSVYAPGWFIIKAQTSFLAGPRILFKLLQAVKGLEDPVCSEVFKEKLQDWAFPLLSENFLASMLFSSKILERRFAAFRICELRSEAPSPIGSQRIQKINFDAQHWSNLITLSSAESEPPITMSLSTEQVEAMVETRGDPPQFPIHTQSVERAVKNTSEAASSSWSWETRHETIVSKEYARAKRPKSDSKQDFLLSTNSSWRR
jgi:hypothetical protein